MGIRESDEKPEEESPRIQKRAHGIELGAKPFTVQQLCIRSPFGVKITGGLLTTYPSCAVST